MKHEPKYQDYWFNLICEFNQSNLSIKKFCKEHNVKDYQFYYWNKKYNKVNETSRVEVTTSKTNNFLMVQPTCPPDEKQSLRLEVNDVNIHIPNNYDQYQLVDLIKLLKTID